MMPTRDGSIFVQVTPRPSKLFLKQMEPRFLEHPSEHLKKFKCISIYINIPKSLMHKQCNTSLSYISLKGIFKALSEGRGSGSKILRKKHYCKKIQKREGKFLSYNFGFFYGKLFYHAQEASKRLHNY